MKTVRELIKQGEWTPAEVRRNAAEYRKSADRALRNYRFLDKIANQLESIAEEMEHE